MNAQHQETAEHLKMVQDVIGHVSRDSTAIEAREKVMRKDKEEKPRRRRGRPRKGEEKSREPKRLERQLR